MSDLPLEPARVRRHFCSLCGNGFTSKHARHFYCESCSESQDLKRKRLLGVRACLKTTHDRRRNTGLIINSGERRTLADYREEPELKWQVRVTFPFSWAASKNAIYRLVPKGHVTLRREARQWRDSLALMLKSALRGQPIVQNKLWIDIFVEKPNQKGDAINVLDTVCDAIKVAAGLDDRWFSIRHLDWAISKDNPQIFLGIGQERVESAQACSYCGRVLPLSAFGKNKSLRLGVARICRECCKNG